MLDSKAARQLALSSSVFAGFVSITQKCNALFTGKYKSDFFLSVLKSVFSLVEDRGERHRRGILPCRVLRTLHMICRERCLHRPAMVGFAADSSTAGSAR